MRLLAAAGTILVTVRSVPAQSRDSVPRDLVTALVHTNNLFNLTFASDLRFTAGRIPPDLAPFLYVSPDARVLGGVMSDRGGVAFITGTGSIDQVHAEYAAEEPKLGWAAPPNPTQDSRSWGFRPAHPTVYSNGASMVFCHIGQTLQIDQVYGPGSQVPGTMTLSLVVSTNGGGLCGGDQPVVAPSALPPQTVLPTLYNPLGGEWNNQRCTIVSRPILGVPVATTRLTTDLTSDRLLDAYGKQLADSGWKSGPVPPATRVWVKPDSAGFTRSLTVSVSPLVVPACKNVTMQLTITKAP